MPRPDDDGLTWTLKSTLTRDPAVVDCTVSETGVIELDDGRLLAISRCNPGAGGTRATGFFSRSDDGGTS